MSKKKNSISIGSFEKAVDANKVTSIPLDGVSDVNIEIKYTISFQEMIEFVEVVSAVCVDAESGRYLPQAKDFAIKREVLTKYANFTLPHNTSKQYEFIYNSNVVESVLEHINKVQFSEILNSIEDKINFELEAINSVATSSVISLVSKLDTAIDESNEVLSGIDHDDIMRMIDNTETIANMDEAKVANALKKIITEE